MDTTTSQAAGTIRTFTGRLFSVLEPDPSAIEIRDIAHALAQQCRFAGHTRVPYSVAQHSVLVSHAAAALDVRAGLWGLLHDASEAYLTDIPRPLKVLPSFAPYRIAERTLQTLIYGQFGCHGREPMAVHQADNDVLAVEFRDLMPHRPGDGWPRRADGAPAITPWLADKAEAEFLLRFLELYRRLR
jgi:hypothetical protein